MRVNVPSPAILGCRDLRAIRACLRYFRHIGTDCVLDFSKLTFVDPGALVLLHHGARAAGPKAKVWYRHPENATTKGYMEDNLGSGKKNAGPGQPRTPNRYPLRYVAKEKDLVTDLGKWREMLQQSGALDEERASEFSSTMSEVLTNSFIHGGNKGACIVAGQTFRERGHSMLVAADSGIGIPASLKNSGRFSARVWPDHEWIKFALNAGITARTRAENRGLGLYILTRLVKNNGGSMTILSGDGVVTLRKGGEPIGEPIGSRYGAFAGTVIFLDLEREARP